MKKLLRPYHIEYLASDLKRRKEINSRYSLRAYARYLGLDPSALSRILAGKQELSLPVSLRVIKKLKLSLEEKQTFLTSVSEVKRRRTAMFLAKGLEGTELCEDWNSKVEKSGIQSVEQILSSHPLTLFHPDPLFVVDRESKIVFANEALGKLLKVCASEMIGKNWKDLNWPEEVYSLIDEQFQSVFLTESIKKIEIPWVRVGQVQNFEYIFSPVVGSLNGTATGNEGKIRFVVSCARNITEHSENREHLNLLSVAGNVLSSAEDFQVALTKAVQIPLSGPADWCTFHWYEGNQVRHFVGSAFQSGKKKWFERFLQRLTHCSEMNWGFQKVLRTGISDLISEVDPTCFLNAGGNYAEIRLFLSLNPKSVLCVPMISFGKVIGAMTWIRSESSIPYQNKDLWIAQKLAQNFAVILERYQSRLSQKALPASIKDEVNLGEAKKSYEKSLNFSSTIISLSASVSQGLTLREFARVILKQGLIALEADYGWIYSFEKENNRLTQVGALGYGEPSMECQFLVHEVIKIREELFIETVEEWNQLRNCSEYDFSFQDQRSFVGVPVFVGKHLLGVVAFAFLKNHVFTEDEKLFLRLLANQFAHALKFNFCTELTHVFT